MGALATAWWMFEIAQLSLRTPAEVKEENRRFLEEGLAFIRRIQTTIDSAAAGKFAVDLQGTAFEEVCVLCAVLPRLRIRSISEAQKYLEELKRTLEAILAPTSPLSDPKDFRRVQKFFRLIGDAMVTKAIEDLAKEDGD